MDGNNESHTEFREKVKTHQWDMVSIARRTLYYELQHVLVKRMIITPEYCNGQRAELRHAI